MHKTGALFLACAGILLLALCTVPAAVAAPPPMLPLEVGNYWNYLGASGAHQIETITGTQTVRGRTVFVKSYAEGIDAGLENFWLLGPDGEVLLAGFDRTGDGYAVAYEPPITICGSAPTVGDTWSTHTTAYNWPDSSVVTVFDITYSALEEVSLIVPAGTFPCIGVGQVAPPTSLASAGLASRGLTLDGRKIASTQSAAADNVTDWYSPGIGEVQYVANDTFRLTGYGNTTPVRGISMGQLRAMYATPAGSGR